MFTDPNLFWKNFRLGTELQVAGAFIYNGLFQLDTMEHFGHEFQSFEFLYDVAVGFERLEKIAVILIEHSGTLDQEEFEKSLITHNHVELLGRIRAKEEINLGKQHIKFLDMLASFYKSTRYDRFNLVSVYKQDQDRKRLISFIEEELKIEIKVDTIIATPNDNRIKRFIGNIIGKIVIQLYNVITHRASASGLYTYEIAYGTKAYKIFMRQEFTFENEAVLKREILSHLLNKKDDDSYIDFIQGITPLGLDMYSTAEYIRFLVKPFPSLSLLDELEHLYTETKFDKDRFQMINAIGKDIELDQPDVDNEDDDLF